MSTTAADPSLSEEEVARLQTGSEHSAAGASGAEARADALSADELFHLLQNSRRRAVLRYLRGREGPVRMRDVAEQVAAWEHDTTVAQLDSDERQRVYIALYQSHLETLADAGVIEYNKPRGVIEPKPVLDHVAAYLDVDVTVSTDGDEAEDEAPWPGRPPVVAVGVTLLLVGPALGLAGLGLLSGVIVGALLLGLCIGVTVTKLLLDG